MAILTDLPVELLLMIIEKGLASGRSNARFNLQDLRALVMTNHKLRYVAISYLYRYDAEHRGSFAVIWAADQGHNYVMALALANKGNPNARFLRNLETGVVRPRLPLPTWVDRKAYTLFDAKRSDRHRPNHPDDLEDGVNVDTLELWKAGRAGFGTPLHLALLQGHRETAKMLLGAGANPGALCSRVCSCSQVGADRLRDTGRYWPSRRHHMEDWEVEIVWSSAFTAMHIALCHGTPSTARLLLDHGASMVVARLYHRSSYFFWDVQPSIYSGLWSEKEPERQIDYLLATPTTAVHRLVDQKLGCYQPGFKFNHLLYNSTAFLAAASACEKNASLKALESEQKALQ